MPARMKPRVRKLLTPLSALLAAAVVALWVRSYFMEDAVLFPFARHSCGVYSFYGQVLVRFAATRTPPAAASDSCGNP